MAEIPRKWLTLGLRRKSPLDIFRNEIYSQNRCKTLKTKRMNKVHLIWIISLVFFFSCTSEDSEDVIEESQSLMERIIDNSPWTYDRLEVISIVETDGYDLQQSEIDDFVSETNQEFNGFNMSFNDDGTGTDTDGEFTWNWIDEEEGEIRIWNDTYLISESNSELILGVRGFAFIPGDECCIEILYDGNIIFK